MFRLCRGAAMSFKIILTIAVAFLCAVKAQNQTEIDCDFPNNNPENCDTTSYLSHLTCSGNDCTCLKEDLSPCEVGDVSYESLTADKCEALCTEDADCRFYKHTTVIILIWS